MPHLDADTIRSFLFLVRDPDHAYLLRMVRQLLACPHCRRSLREILDDDPATSEPLSSALPQRLFRTAQRILLASETQTRQDEEAASQLHLEILAQAPDERPALLEFQPKRFSSPALVRRLLEDASTAIEEDPSTALHLTTLSLTIADTLPPSSLVNRLFVAAHCALAEAHRRRGALELASEVLKEAARNLFDEAQFVDVRAQYCLTLAAIRSEQLRHDEALALFERATDIYLTLGDDHGLATVALANGKLLLDLDEQESAVSILIEALNILDPARWPDLYRETLSTLALAYADLGRNKEVREAVISLQKLQRQRRLRPSRPLEKIHLRLLRARTRARLGELRRAINSFERIVRDLLEQKAFFDSAAVSLELASLYCEREDPTGGRSLVDLLTHGVKRPPNIQPATPLLTQKFIAQLKPLALNRGLPPRPFAVVDFALTLTSNHAGSFQDVLTSAILYLARARFNPDLPFYPLPETDRIIHWSEISNDSLVKAAQAAGITRLDLSSLRHQQLIAWAHEALTGERLRTDLVQDDTLDESLPN